MKRSGWGVVGGVLAVGAAAWACCPWVSEKKAAVPGTAPEAAVTAGGLVDAAYAAEPAKPGKAAKKKFKAAASKYECPSCKMAFDHPGDCPACKVGLVPKRSASRP